MSKILDSIKDLITPELISNASSSLGENKTNLTKAVTSIVPSLLGSLLAKGDNPGVESALLSAGKEKDSILGGISDLLSGTASENTSSLGSGFLNSLLGDKLSGFTSMIASHSGISTGSSSKLVSVIGSLVASVLGNKLMSGGLNLSGLLGMLNKEKANFLDMIPSSFGSLLGVTSMANLGNSLASGVGNTAETVVDTVVDTAKKGSGWLKWLIGILALGVLGFFILKTCGKKADEIKTDVKAMVDTVSNKVSTTVEKVSTELTLPDGMKLTGFKGGIEDQMIVFLQSDGYKNSTEDVLKDKWFDFDNIDFVHGSATKLTPESAPQLANIVSILKYYKDAKVKIGGYTDKTGGKEANMKLSDQRAKSIKSVLEKGGVDGKRVSTEGYGDQFAKYGADAPDSDRVHDRKISLRFVK